MRYSPCIRQCISCEGPAPRAICHFCWNLLLTNRAAHPEALYLFRPPFRKILTHAKSQPEHGPRALIKDLLHHDKAYIDFKVKDPVRNDFCVTYIPSPPSRTLSRGFDVGAFLAKEMSLLLKCESLPLLKTQKLHLPRRAQRKTQSELEHIDPNRYQLSRQGQKHKYQSVILIDDVLTTGFTARSAKYTLEQAGYNTHFIALAKTSSSPQYFENGVSG